MCKHIKTVSYKQSRSTRVKVIIHSCIRVVTLFIRDPWFCHHQWTHSTLGSRSFHFTIIHSTSLNANKYAIVSHAVHVNYLKIIVFYTLFDFNRNWEIQTILNKFFFLVFDFRYKYNIYKNILFLGNNFKIRMFNLKPKYNNIEIFNIWILNWIFLFNLYYFILHILESFNLNLKFFHFVLDKEGNLLVQLFVTEK